MHSRPSAYEADELLLLPLRDIKSTYFACLFIIVSSKPLVLPHIITPLSLWAKIPYVYSYAGGSLVVIRAFFLT